ncbi:MAG: FAD-dependent oxidoreductase, partial [Actinobacteria bacterium]|nr:FAD-dependent oxidoreductase [Actinomycetota bacterium]
MRETARSANGWAREAAKPLPYIDVSAEQFDLVVVGGGPGGYAAAFYAASAGMKVALVEKDTIGGTCLNRGCIPAKAFLESAAVFRHVAHAKDFGVEASAPSVNFAVTQARKQTIVNGLVKGLTGLTKSKKVTYLLGTGSLGAGRTVTVKSSDGSSKQLVGANVILAAGSVPRTIPGFAVGGPIMTSDEVLALDKIPSRIAVIGGGAIGSFLSARLHEAGHDILLVARGERLEMLQAEGVRLLEGKTDRQVRVPVSGACDPGASPDHVILATKTFQLESALELLEPLNEARFTLLTVQNGVEAPKIAQAALPRTEVLGARMHGFFELEEG